MHLIFSHLRVPSSLLSGSWNMTSIRARKNFEKRHHRSPQSARYSESCPARIAEFSSVASLLQGHLREIVAPVDPIEDFINESGVVLLKHGSLEFLKIVGHEHPRHDSHQEFI